jgi:hypothetical protein
VLDRHPRNRDFHWRAGAPPYRLLSSRQAAQYDAQGFLLVESAFTADEMDAVAEAIAPHERAGEAWLRNEVTPLGLQCLREAEEAVAVPARKGDIVVFSSLTPHRTGPNLTGQTRKAYILQYAPDGARAWRGDAAPVLQNDPERQYLVG